MEKVINGWEVLGQSIESPPLPDLDVDCVAVGIASLNGPAVHFEQLLFLQGEIHEEPETLQSHCASLVDIVADLVRQANELHSSKTPAYVAPPTQENEELDWYQFTARELEILKLIASGISNKQIARELGASPNTVRNQIHALFRKAKVTNRTELALRVAAAI
ncbi:response regulator transcription factor [Pseudomonas alkylphenolica]|uniref:response regulator transcription factor n=1 Tax=Pseudomonas alkylphenolica TaxID=237609 RepID=UPI000FBFF153